MTRIIFKIIATLGVSALLTIFGCANQPQNVSNEEPHKSSNEIAQGKAITNEAAIEVDAKSFVEIQFKPESSKLTDLDRKSIRSLLEQSERAGSISEVLVLSWSDEEYPSKQMKGLPKAQVELASHRSSSIQDYLKSVRSVDVETYNLAKQPNVFSKWFNTTDFRLKDALVAAGLPTTADAQQYPSKASHSVLIVKMKQ